MLLQVSGLIKQIFNAPGGAFAPVKLFDPAPGGVFARQIFLTRPRGALARAYPGPRNSLLKLLIRGFLDSVDYFVACSCPKPWSIFVFTTAKNYTPSLWTCQKILPG